MEEGHDFQSTLVQPRIVLCEVAQAKIAHRAGGITIEHQQQWFPGKLLESDSLAIYRLNRKGNCFITSCESHALFSSLETSLRRSKSLRHLVHSLLWLTQGNGIVGSGMLSARQMGAHPSAARHSSRRWGAVICLTCALCR